MHACVKSVCVYMCVCVCMCVCLCVCVCVCMHVYEECVCVCVCMHVGVFVCEAMFVLAIGHHLTLSLSSSPPCVSISFPPPATSLGSATRYD